MTTFRLATNEIVIGWKIMIPDTVLPSGFLDFFDFEAITDPTHGRVNYVDKSTAQAKGLVEEANSTSFIIRADSTTVLDPSGPGQNSVRIRSKTTYTTHVAVFNLQHMPEGCGTWPAIWETNKSDWPNGGEVDIMEGVNNQSPNAATLHTSAGCTMPSSWFQTGKGTQLDCDANVNGNTGYGVLFPTDNSFGPSFNVNGGGWYAVERSSTLIRVFFWPRDSDSVPKDVRNGDTTVDTDNWGVPVALFPNADSPNAECDIKKYFNDHNIIINLTFCGFSHSSEKNMFFLHPGGDYAGNTSLYPLSGCPSTCVDFVNNNPSSFSNAYFDFTLIRVYE